MIWSDAITCIKSRASNDEAMIGRRRCFESLCRLLGEELRYAAFCVLTIASSEATSTTNLHLYPIYIYNLHLKTHKWTNVYIYRQPLYRRVRTSLLRGTPAFYYIVLRFTMVISIRAQALRPPARALRAQKFSHWCSISITSKKKILTTTPLH